MGDVLALTRLAHPVTLDRAREDHRGLPLGLGRVLVGVEDLGRIVPAEPQPLQLVVGHVLDHLEQAWIGAEEMLAEVRARLDGVFLILAVHHFAHALREEAVVIVGEERIPVAAPQDLDHVPPGAAEARFELLDDLAVAAHRAVEPLQVAVDDPDQVVQLLARREADRAERFGLVGLAVAQERPDLAGRRLLQPAIFQVAIEARLVDRHDRPEAHRDSRELPEIRHQPGMRIGREAAARGQLVAEVVELLARQPAFEKRARVDAGRRVPLEINHVAVAVASLAFEEVVERHFVESRRRGVGRDVAADPVRVAIGADHHRHRVPADEALDPPLDLLAAGERGLLVGRDGVDVGRDRRERQRHSAHPRMMADGGEEPLDAAAVSLLDDVVEGFAPLALFQGF